MTEEALSFIFIISIIIFIKKKFFC